MNATGLAGKLPPRLELFLWTEQARYSLTPASWLKAPHARDPGDTLGTTRWIRTVALEDAQGIVLALLPNDHILDIESLCGMLHRELRPLPEHRCQTVFPDCEAGCYPPLGRAYGVSTVVDIELYKFLELAFHPGHRHTVLRLSTRELQRILHSVELGRFSFRLKDGAAFRKARQQEDHDTEALHHLFPKRVPRTTDRCDRLPSLPETARRLLQLAANPAAGASDLARIIARDAPTTANILRYANSSLYGFSGKIHDLKDAIARVLGFDAALAIAIGMNIGGRLHVPEAGPLGLQAFRRDSVYCAELAQALARQLPKDLGITPGKAYLAGLLHNLGLLLLAQTYPDQYQMLATAISVNPQVPVTTIEGLFMDTRHEALAGRLLRDWELPGEAIAAIEHHHDASYQGEHAPYVQLVRLAAGLLSEYGVSRRTWPALPADALRRLGITETAAREVALSVLEQAEAIEQLVQLVA